MPESWRLASDYVTLAGDCTLGHVKPACLVVRQEFLHCVRMKLSHVKSSYARTK